MHRVESAGSTLAAAVREMRPDLSWSRAKRLVESRFVRLNDVLSLDPARRVKVGDVIEILSRAGPLPASVTCELIIRHLDDHVVVVEKPAGLNTTRHPAERDWAERRRALSPTLDDRLQLAIAGRLRRPNRTLPTLRKVHRLDKLTSGLLVFARSPFAERELGRQFKAHTVRRLYLAVVAGRTEPQTVRSWLVRDRGDGRRGSSGAEGRGKLAVTHLTAVEPLGRSFSMITCRLETGRTHQIRIHLAELGHPVCGDPVYSIRPDGTRFDDYTGAARLALHAAELGFCHPATGEALNWTMDLPPDLSKLIANWKSDGRPVD